MTGRSQGKLRKRPPTR
ncbi:MAG: hypothetical protein ABUK17_04370 [Syntrophobacteria bacterium]